MLIVVVASSFAAVRLVVWLDGSGTNESSLGGSGFDKEDGTTDNGGRHGTCHRKMTPTKFNIPVPMSMN